MYDDSRETTASSPLRVRLMRLGQLQGGSVVFQRRATLDFGADGWQAGTAFTFVQNTIVQVPQTNNTSSGFASCTNPTTFGLLSGSQENLTSSPPSQSLSTGHTKMTLFVTLVLPSPNNPCRVASRVGYAILIFINTHLSAKRQYYNGNNNPIIVYKWLHQSYVIMSNLYSSTISPSRNNQPQPPLALRKMASSHNYAKRGILNNKSNQKYIKNKKD